MEILANSVVFFGCHHLLLELEEKHKDCDLGDVKKTQIHFDPEVVQIKAGKAEVRSWVLGGQGSIF